MKAKASALKCLTALGRVAYQRQGTRATLDQVGTPAEGPSAGAVVTSALGVLMVPCAILADYYLLAAPIEYIASLAAAGSALAARLLVPVVLALVDLGIGMRRALDRYEPYGEDERRRQRWTPLILAVLAIQVAAAVAQYLALEASNPSPANGVVLGFLGLLAIVTHAATLFLAGESALLLVTAAGQRRRDKRRATLMARLRNQTRELLRHYRAWTDLSGQHRRDHPDDPLALELDPVVVAELNDAIGFSGLDPPRISTEPCDPHGPDGPNEPPNPYTQADMPDWADDQRL
ncbi:MAG TPA: hypothetical protein PKJ99_09435 [Thermoanaerobaculales bacterium]|nr:hypothetical protein [Thermoanaerobaculales bacterium]